MSEPMPLTEVAEERAADRPGFARHCREVTEEKFGVVLEEAAGNFNDNGLSDDPTIEVIAVDTEINEVSGVCLTDVVIKFASLMGDSPVAFQQACKKLICETNILLCRPSSYQPGDDPRITTTDTPARVIPENERA